MSRSHAWWLPVVIVTAGCTFDSAGFGESGNGSADATGESATSSGVTSSSSTTLSTSDDGGSGDGPGSSGSGGTTSVATTAVDEWLAPFAFRKQISVAATVAPLADFPVAIVLEADDDVANSARADGFDIVFTAEDGTSRLSHEIERYDGAGGLVAWVSVRSLSVNEATVLYMYYGDPAAADPQDVAGTWPATVAGVWHLAGRPTATAPQYRDSTIRGNHGTVAGAVTQAPGIGGIGIGLDGTGGEVSLGDPADESLDFGMDSFSYELWLFASATTGPFDMPWYKGGASAGSPGYDMELGAGAWNAGLSSQGEVIVGSFGLDVDLVGQWTHLVAVVDRDTDTLRLFTNGELASETDISSVGSLATDVPAQIGRTNSYLVEGIIDEVRVWGRALDPAWVAAEYANFTDPGFVMVGPEQGAP